MTSFPCLSAPLSVEGRTFPNRVVMPPLVKFHATPEGLVTDAVLAHYADCAGPGLVVVEATAVSPEGRLAQLQLGIFEDRHVEGLSALAQVIHRGGGLAAIQIHHAGRQTTRENTFGGPLLAPSAVPSPAVSVAQVPGEIPEELSEEGIERILDCFAAAARRALAAGFDAVEIHGAHGYLGSQFLSPEANRRQDRWGGSLENRSRFLREALRRTREAVDGRLLVYCRLGVIDADPSGLSLEDGVAAARLLEADGIPLLHVSNGIGLPSCVAPAGSPWSDRFHLAMAVKRAVSIPVIGVGNIITPAQAERAVSEGLVDMVAVGRGILADPAWASKALSGREAEIVTCRQCRLCMHYRHADRCPARRQAALAGE